KGVYSTYDRILKEMRTNDVQERMLSKVYKTIYLPLQQASETQFDRTYNAVVALRRELDAPSRSVAERIEASAPKAAEARKQLNDLARLMATILENMEGLSKLNELIAQLAQIERDEEALGELVGRVLKRRIKEALDEDK